MPNLLSLLRQPPAAAPAKRYSMQDYFNDAALAFAYGGHQYPLSGYSAYGGNVEDAESSFVGYVRAVYKSSGPVFACMLVRQLVFSEARFQWQQIRGGRPGTLFGTSGLSILERPWPNGTTGELLSRMEQDASLAGNAYVAKDGNRLRRLRPDWTSIVLTAPPDEAVASDVEGYLYQPGGLGGRGEPRIFMPEDVTHWTPIPDPEAQYRGMSWITPIAREVMGDKSAMTHKLAFYDNAATPQLAVSLKESVTPAQFKDFVSLFNEKHKGADKAGATLFLGGGADVQVVGKDLQQLDFKASQGHGESRIAAASGVGAVVAQLSEGMQGSSLNAGNYLAARRRVGDGLFRPLWRSVSAALETVAPPPTGARLWYDERGIPFLQEDEKDAAEIEQIKAATIRQLVDGGYDPSSVVAAVDAADITLLKHTGLTSVQLLPPGTTAEPVAAADDAA